MKLPNLLCGGGGTKNFFCPAGFFIFTDAITWFSKDDSRDMRYSQPALKFIWLGKNLFGGRFVRFMSGLKNETDLLKGNAKLNPMNPADSKINFACHSGLK